MIIWKTLYTLLIGPLELFFDVLFSFVYRFIPDPGFSILFLSIAVNLLIFPLYRRAEAMQKEERDKEAGLDPWIRHIRKTFKGDERYMMLRTLYRQNDHKPAYSLKGSVSLFLQVPFFIAAYNFLSGLELLKRESFGPIQNLALPDGLVTVSGVPVNILPILMTLINFISAAIYLKGFPVKNKIQVYGTALVFLVLLYDSPSGLVLYWTFNNLFSLIKNVLERTEDPKKVLKVSACLIGFVIQQFVLIFHPFSSVRKSFLIAVVCLILEFPFLSGYFIKRKIHISIPPADRKDDKLFTFCTVFMALLTGVLIPSEVIKTDPTDFINAQLFYSPLWYVAHTVLISTGTFVIWCGVFYKLFSRTGKKLMSLAMWILSVCSIVNYMFFGKDRGNMSASLVFDAMPSDPLKDCLVNFGVLLIVSALLFLLWKKKASAAAAAAVTFCLAAGVMSAINVNAIRKTVADIRNIVYENPGEIPEIRLSKNGKNVIVLMIDRSAGFYIPFLMEEKPELQKQFAGFTFYPQTLSFANMTNAGLPPVYGGYEYTPEKTNNRPELSLAEKHNEALQMMPFIFDDAGYEVTILQPTYANYKTPSDLHIYDEHPNIRAYNTDGVFSSDQVRQNAIDLRNRNFFCYSLFKIVPLFFQPSLYTYGMYNDTDALTGSKEAVLLFFQKQQTMLTAAGIKDTFEAGYSVLANLAFMTNIEDTDENTFTALDNATAHEPILLQMPDYVPAEKVDNTPYEQKPIFRYSADGQQLRLGNLDQVMHYHVNMAAYLQLGKWMDFLRENGVYDNSRIIITADHGATVGYSQYSLGEDKYENILCYNPVLMFKDFESSEFSVDERFMTNAEVPTIALKGLIEDPVNPKTGSPITNDDKENTVHKIQVENQFNININNGNTFLPSKWYSFRGNDIFDPENWTYEGEH